MYCIKFESRWDVLTNQECVDFLHERLYREEPLSLRQALTELLDRCLCPDAYSFIIILFVVLSIAPFLSRDSVNESESASDPNPHSASEEASESGDVA